MNPMICPGAQNSQLCTFNTRFSIDHNDIVCHNIYPDNATGVFRAFDGSAQKLTQQVMNLLIASSHFTVRA
jgi:hypothetical protein